MARKALALALTSCTWRAVALQVAPSSPCSAVCIDSSDLDSSSFKSSNTVNKDISCYDTEYETTTAGDKYEQCMQCLQDSKYSYGSENDQSWFLYNMRYTVDYCVFGFPNASNVASTPCSTSTACGGLQNALTGDKLVANGAEQYDYCSADGSAMSGPSVSKCIACVAASGDQQYLTNFVVALQAACQQQPPVGTLIGLNETVFSKTTVQAAAPSSASTSSNKSGPSTPSIVGIVAAVIVVILLIAAIFYVRRRKRQNRRLRLGALPSHSQGSRHMDQSPTSPLSFACQAHLSPTSAKFYTVSDGIVRASTFYTEKNEQVVPPYADPLSPELPAERKLVMSRKGSLSNKAGLQLDPIATSGPAKPGNVYYTSSSPRLRAHSPTEQTPIPDSTTSTKSTTNLLPLKPYNPADYAGIAHSPPLPRKASTAQGARRASDSPQETHHMSPSSASTTSPLISGLGLWNHDGFSSHAAAQQQHSRESRAPLPRMSNLGSNMADTLSKGRHKGVATGTKNGSPTETQQIQVVFPGPPQPRR